MISTRTISIMLMIGAWAACALACAEEAAAQDQRGLPVRVDTLRVVGPGPFIIRPFIRPGTLTIDVGGEELSPSLWSADYRRGLITFNGVDPDSAFIFVAAYRHLPIDDPGEMSLWPHAADDTDQMDPTGRGTARLVATPGLSALQRSGSITRGVLTGSGRDASIESGLRLELSGEIAPGVDVRASLSDEDTPILPEGTTRRLDQFDRVFIGLSARPGTLVLGDIAASVESGSYAHLSRKLQGVSATSNPMDLGGTGRLGAVTAGGASVRGRFRVQQIDALEGVQGPYRLRGDGGETFILVLPGTERVYLDGVLMERGASNDYVIDYATAEITFANRRIIGADRRIRVEFEYTTQQFSRTMIFADGSAGVGRSSSGMSRFELGLTAIREADGEQFSEEFGFSAADSAAVRMAGDDDVLRSGATLVAYDPEALFTQYVVEPQVVGSDTTDAFVPVTSRPDDGTDVYRVSFTRLGPGQGSYTRSGTDVNGVTYSFVGPGQGSYEPVRRLPSPLRRQLMDLRTVFRPTRSMELRAEVAASRVDRNLISTLDDADNDGQALALEGSWASPILRVSGTEIGRVNLDGRFHSRSADFETFDRIRSIEFEREWNLRGRTIETGRNAIPGQVEQETSLQAGLARADSTGFSLRIARLDLGDNYQGDRSIGTLRWMSAGPRLMYRIDRVVTRDSLIDGREAWARHFGRVERRDLRAALRPFVEVEAEQFTGDPVAVSDPDSDTLDSRDFIEVRTGADFSADKLALGASVERREEFVEVLPEVSDEGRVIWTSRVSGAYSDPGRLRTDASIGIRLLDDRIPVTDAPGPGARESDALLLEWNGNLRTGRRTDLSWLYDARSERSATLQEIYIRTGQERGRFVWQDLNGDGATQIQEFIPETIPGEGEYVRTFLPSDSLTAVTSVTARIRLQHRPDRTPNRTPRRPTGGLTAVELLQRIGSETLIEVTEKSTTPDRSDVYLLQLGTFRSAHETLNGRLRVRQQFSVRPGRGSGEVRLTLQDVRSRSRLAAGSESTRSSLAELFGRTEITDGLTGQMRTAWMVNSRASASFSTRTFDIVGVSAEPSADIRLSDRVTLTPGVFGAWRKDRASDLVARIVRTPVEVLYQAGGSIRLSGRVESSIIRLDEDAAGLAAFELTDGRGRGSSWLWNAGLRWLVNENLTATVVYDGRAPDGSSVIHTARFQLRAQF